MTGRDDDPPNNVIPFGHVVPYAIAEQLRLMYAAFVEEELPAGILALMQQFKERTKEQAKQQPAADTAAGEAEQKQPVGEIATSAVNSTEADAPGKSLA
jgi:hypothetical protein